MIEYNFPIDEPFTEEITIVGNNRYWKPYYDIGATIDFVLRNNKPDKGYKDKGRHNETR